MLKKIFQIILILILLACVAGLIYWGIVYKNWPWWMGLTVVAGVVFLWIGIVFIKKYLLRKKESEFVRRVVAQDDMAIATAPLREKKKLQELQNKWLKAIELLRYSYLRRHGNPLYVLPWFLVLGDAGSGKTTALRNAHLSSSMTDIDCTAGISGTRNCDWWFYEQAIILDTAGRYAIPEDNVEDNKEWEKFLNLLSKYRKKEPINGVILTIPADALLTQKPEILRENGQSLRKRLNQLMTVMGYKFPVYLMITKMDHVLGMIDFCEQLPEKMIDQAMGYICRNKSYNWKDIVYMTISNITGNLKKLRIVTAYENSDIAAKSLLFPKEFIKLQSGLISICRAIFEEHEYLENPHFRGIFFSSARHDVLPKSDKLDIFNTKQKEEIKSVEKGYFLKDFFQRILTADRFQYSPISEYLIWKKLTKNLGLFTWVLLFFFLIGLLSFSYFKNLNTIKNFTTEFYYTTTLPSDPYEAIITMNKIRLEIIKMEEANKKWFIPRFKLRQSLAVENYLKERYINLFNNEYITPRDNEIMKSLDEIEIQSNLKFYTTYVEFVVIRITLLKDFIEGDKNQKHLEQLKKISIKLFSEDKFNPQVPFIFAETYKSYLFWSMGKKNLQEDLRILEANLKILLEKENNNFEWLTNRTIYAAEDINLNDFWRKTDEYEVDKKYKVPGAFTKEGRDHIHAFIRLMGAAFKDTSYFSTKINNFWLWYEEQFCRLWLEFTRDIDKDFNSLGYIPEWKNFSILMTTEDNPYFLYFIKLAEEVGYYLKENPDLEKKTSWTGLVLYLDGIRKEAIIQKKMILGKLVEKKEKKIEQKLESKKLGNIKQSGKEIQEIKAWNDYITSLQKVAPAVSDDETCFKVISKSFPSYDDPKGELVFSIVYQNYHRFYSFVKKEKGDSPIIWNLIRGPLDYLIRYAVNEAADVLQQQWKDQVIGRTQGSAKDKLPSLLFDKSDGLVWKFVEGPANPFIGVNKYGYYAIESFNTRIPFTEEFIQFLDNGAVGVINYKDSYIVKLQNIPIEVNDNVKTEPYGCILKLQCLAGETILENYNTPETQIFIWTPATCGNVTLEILFPDLTLTKTYKGKFGFARFLNDLRDGSTMFHINDFPDQVETLKDMGIIWITISYVIEGGQEVIPVLKMVPSYIPEKIIQKEYIAL